MAVLQAQLDSNKGALASGAIGCLVKILKFVTHPLLRQILFASKLSPRSSVSAHWELKHWRVKFAAREAMASVPYEVSFGLRRDVKQLAMKRVQKLLKHMGWAGAVNQGSNCRPPGDFTTRLAGCQRWAQTVQALCS